MNIYEVEVERTIGKKTVEVTHVNLMGAVDLFTCTYGDSGIMEVKFKGESASVNASIIHDGEIGMVMRRGNA